MVTGPLLGGLLSTFLGFRSVLIFPTIVAAVVLVVSAISLPETQKRMEEVDPVRLSGLHQPLDEKMQTTKPEGYRKSTQDVVTSCKSKPRNIGDTLRILIEKDTAASLVFAGVVFSVWTMVTVSTPELFKKKFALDDFLLGLALVPSGKDILPVSAGRHSI
jgi:MFS family permease